MAKAYADFGYTNAFVSMYPELKPLLDQAANENWDGTRFETELKNQAWYRNRNASQRAYDSMLALDPAEAGRLREEKRLIVERMAASAGSTLGPHMVEYLSNYAVREGWDEEEINRQVVRHMPEIAPAVAGGDYGANIDKMKAVADDYGIAMTDANLAQWSRNILTGYANIEGYETYLQQQAKVQYPTAADFLDQGMTIRQITDPYLRLAEQSLGQPATTFNLMDPKWTAALRSKDDPSRMATMDEWQVTLRKDERYGYANSDQAVREASTLGERMNTLMGGV